MALSRKDYDKLQRLRAVFDRNYRWTQLLSDLLSYAPEIITKEMVDTLCEGTELSKKEAVLALMTEVLGLHPEERAEDRILQREYLAPSIFIFSPDRYESDPYVRQIAGRETKNGRFEYKMKHYPPYRAAVAGDVLTGEDFAERMPLCFFDGDFSFFAALEDDNEWMTLTPVDIDTSREAIERARGRVLTFGLGLGYYAFMASEKAEVSSVTVVEKSREVIEAFKSALLPHFPHKEKIRIVEADAFEYAEKEMGKENFDLAFVDTWRDAGDGLPMYLKMKRLEKHAPCTEFLYWIEHFLLSRLRCAVFEDIYERESRAAHGSVGDRDFSEVLRALSDGGLRTLAEEGTAEVLRLFLEDEK